MKLVKPLNAVSFILVMFLPIVNDLRLDALYKNEVGIVFKLVGQLSCTL